MAGKNKGFLTRNQCGQVIWFDKDISLLFIHLNSKSNSNYNPTNNMNDPPVSDR